MELPIVQFGHIIDQGTFCDLRLMPLLFGIRPEQGGNLRISREELCKKMSSSLRVSGLELHTSSFESDLRINRFGAPYRVTFDPPDTTGTYSRGEWGRQVVQCPAYYKFAILCTNF